MEILRADLGSCSGLTGAVVVIDVLRSFSTAAYAFAGGARAIYPVDSVAGARALRARIPGALTMGAAGGGAAIPDFDFSNSPAALLRVEPADPAPYLRRVRYSDFGRRFNDPERTDLPAADLDYCAIADRFDFAMRVRWEEGRPALWPVAGRQNERGAIQ